MQTEAYVFDTETTDKDLPEIIESSWMKFSFSEKGTLQKELPVTLRFKPLGRISYGAMATHHILDEDLINEPDVSTFKLPEDTQYIAGHNVDFDWRCAGSPADIKRIDTLGMARTLWPDLDSHSLGAITYFLFKSEAKLMLTNAHSAEVDIINTTKILEKILEAANIKTMDELWLYSEMCRFPKVITFGKHKGETIEHIIKTDRNYIDWYATKSDNPDPYLVRAMRGETAESFKEAYLAALALPKAVTAVEVPEIDAVDLMAKVNAEISATPTPTPTIKRRF